jgi:hypothetical protein
MAWEKSSIAGGFGTENPYLKKIELFIQTIEKGG